MNLEESVNIIVDFLRKEFHYYFSVEEKDTILSSFDMIMAHIDRMKKNVKINEYPVQLVVDSLEKIRRKVIYNHIDNKIKSFILAYCEIVLNWNFNLSKDNKIKSECDNILILIHGHYTMMDAINVMKQITSKLENLKNWNPPSFELSEHYIKKLGK